MKPIGIKLIMSTIKVMGMYGQLPSGIKISSGILFLLFMGPFLPVLLHMHSIKESITLLTLLLPVLTYIVSTFVIVLVLMKKSKEWKQEEYDEITIDLAVFRFILLATIYACIHFGLYYLILQLESHAISL
jgi:hypothetical protein